MNFQNAGQILRMGGLILELVGVITILAGRGSHVGIPGVGSVHVGWAVVVAGFLLWMGGTALIVGSRSRR
jgi:hypothetical protein